VESNILKNNVFCYEVWYTYFGIEFLPYPKKLFKIVNLFYSKGQVLVEWFSRGTPRPCGTPLL